ncbi:MAG: tetratricopeptide repeat protein [Bacteroidota bacterium]
MRTIKSLIFLIIFAVSSLSSFANKELEGNVLYRKGDLKAAIEAYKLLLKDGQESSEIHYNLGNCYYKTNDISNCILQYERALKLSPKDEDIQFNLKLANLKVIDKIQTVDKIFFKRWLETLSRLFAIDTAATYTILFMWLAAIILALYIAAGSSLLKRIFFYSGLTLLLLSITMLILTNYRNNDLTSTSSGIIFSPTVYIKSAPDDKSTDLFILHEGTKVQILDAVGSWKKIRLMNNNEGWIKSETLEVI